QWDVREYHADRRRGVAAGPARGPLIDNPGRRPGALPAGAPFEKDSPMRGRLPSGPAFVDRLDGSLVAKERLKVLLETLAATCRIGDACARLGIQESRFEQVRLEVLQAALAAAEQRRAGRGRATRATPRCSCCGSASPSWSPSCEPLCSA